METHATAKRIIDSPYLPVAIFAGMTFAGCLYIWLTKMSGVGIWLAITVPIMVMFAYLGLSIIVGRLRIHDEQVGDNLYYMGFLFTLTSLGVSLYLFSADGEMNEVVRNFGVAITSTITGIALRICYNQARRDPADVERAARHELAGMSRRVRAEMENVTLEFSEFRRICNQMLTEGYGEIVKQAQLNGEQVRQSFEKMSSEAIKPVKETSERLADALDNSFGRIEDRFTGVLDKVSSVATLLDKANTSFGEAVGRFETQADSVAGKLEKLVIPDTVLREEIVPVVNLLAASVGRHVEKTGALVKEQETKISELAEAVGKFVEASDSERATMVKILDKTEEREKAITSLADRLERKLESRFESPPAVQRDGTADHAMSDGRLNGFELPVSDVSVEGGNTAASAAGTTTPEIMVEAAPGTAGTGERPVGILDRLKGWRS